MADKKGNYPFPPSAPPPMQYDENPSYIPNRPPPPSYAESQLPLYPQLPVQMPNMNPHFNNNSFNGGYPQMNSGYGHMGPMPNYHQQQPVHYVNPGQYGGQNPGQYVGQNPGQYGGQNPGQYGGQNPGQYVSQNPGQYGGQPPQMTKTSQPHVVEFDAGARFNGRSNGPISVPPPPPGCAATPAQLAAMQGQPVIIQKKKNSFF